MRLLVACLLAGSGVAQAQDAATALARAGRAYDSLTALRAEFTQQIVNPMLGAPEHSRGVLFLARPDRFAMRFDHPTGDRIVADGSWLWLYTPSTVPGQVIRQPVPTSGATSPNLFAQFVERPAERYRTTYLGTDSVAGALVDLVRLVPRDEELPFQEAVIAVARRDGLLRRVVLIESTGQRRTLVFPKISAVAAVPSDELRFRVPAGVKIVTP